MRGSVWLVAAWGLGLGVIASVALGAVLFDVPVGELTRDPAALTPDLRPYSGSMSILTVVTWGSVATTCLLASLVTRQRQRPSLRLLACLALVLLVDDALLLHERVGPAVGIPEVAFLGLYGALGLSLLLAFWHQRSSAAAAAYLLGGALLAGSFGVDLLAASASDAGYLAEDGLKLLGALTWVAVPFSSVRQEDMTTPRLASGRSRRPSATPLRESSSPRRARVRSQG